MTKKLFTKVVSVSLAAAMVLSMAPVNAAAAKAVKPKSMKAPKSSMIKVGQTKTITATRKAKKSDNDVKYVKFSPKKTKNIGISVKTSDDAVVSVEKVSDGRYTYTGVNAGTATLTITSRAKTEKGKKLKATMDITVINPFKVTQTGAYTFTMSTADKLEKVDKRDVKVVQEGNTIDNAVKEVKLSEDKMSVEVTMEIPFVDQKKYEVTFGKDVDSFVASVGAPAAINIKTQSVVVNKPTEIEYAVVDEKGMDVTKVLDASKITVDVTTKSGFYDAKAKKLTLWKVGDTAEVKVVYHTWTYDATTGKENVIEGKGTVTCVDKSAVTVTGLDKWTIADRVLSWDTDKMTTMIPQGESSKIWVRMKKSDGTYVDNKKNKADFTFDPISTATLYVYADGSVYSTREGMEYAKVTYFDGAVKYQYTLPITVGAKAKATTLVLSQPFVTISKDAAVPTPITLKVLNQYGDAMDLSAFGFTSNKISGEDVAMVTKTGVNAAKDIMKLAVAKTGREGTGVYKLTVEGLNISLTVNAQNVASLTSGYMLKAAVNEFDATVNEATSNPVLEELAKGVELHFYETKAGLIDKNADMKFAGAKIKVNGQEYTPDALGLVKRNADNSLVFQPIVKDSANNFVVLTKAGGYNIEATTTIGGNEVVVSAFINVTNNTALPTSSSYAIGSLSGSTATSVKAMVDEVVENKVVPFVKLANNDKYSMILHKANKLDNTLATIDTTVADAFYLDTAALPSFKTDAKDLIWVVKEGLHEKLDVVKKANVTAAAAVVETAKFIKDEVAGVTKVAKVKLTGTDLNNLKEFDNTAKWTEGGADTAVYELVKIEKEGLNATNTELTLNLHIKVSDGQTVAAGNDTLTFDYDGKGASGTVVNALDYMLNTDVAAGGKHEVAGITADDSEDLATVEDILEAGFEAKAAQTIGTNVTAEMKRTAAKTLTIKFTGAANTLNIAGTVELGTFMLKAKDANHTDTKIKVEIGPHSVPAAGSYAIKYTVVN